MDKVNRAINKNCSCGNGIKGNYEVCGVCRSKGLMPNCKHYKEINKSMTVPFCKLHNQEILGKFEFLKCRDCETRRVIDEESEAS